VKMGDEIKISKKGAKMASRMNDQKEQSQYHLHIYSFVLISNLLGF